MLNLQSAPISHIDDIFVCKELPTETAAAHLDIDICIAFQQRLRVNKTTQHVMEGVQSMR